MQISAIQKQLRPATTRWSWPAAAGLASGALVSMAAALVIAVSVLAGIVDRLRTARASNRFAGIAAALTCPRSLCRLRCPHRVAS